jgi:hypothetical protein
MTTQLTLLDEARAAVQDDLQPQPPADRYLARVKSWEWQREAMMRDWLRWLRETNDPARIKYLQSKLDYLKGLQ